MTTYFFVGDGCEVLGCEAMEANAREIAARLKSEQPDNTQSINVYECDPSETTRDSAGKLVWSYPAERCEAEKQYDLPTMREVVIEMYRGNHRV